MENAKVYVDVLVNFDKDGTMSPVDFIWEDGEKYHVDRIFARERCASRKAGGTGICYTIMVNGKESHLYYEFGLWRDAVPNRLTEYRTTHNIWKYNVDTHYILCYSIIELSFMHSTLCREI